MSLLKSKCNSCGHNFTIPHDACKRCGNIDSSFCPECHLHHDRRFNTRARYLGNFALSTYGLMLVGFGVASSILGVFTI